MSTALPRARHLAGLAGLLVLSACSTLGPQVSGNGHPPAAAACVPVADGDPLVGNWLSVSAQAGVAGALRTLYTLNADGSMAYVEQIKRPRQPSQGLYETGCWTYQGQTLTLRTQESNGLPVNLDDPIYINRFRVLRVQPDALRLQGPQGQAIQAKRMSPGYRLPF
ncbi:hypothetical protein [Castellaniella sp.]|uniref:hypothetical protein n=1 Tax=Castellaniella sp. TaxID=1955812 RepID=UPI00355F5B75